MKFALQITAAVVGTLAGILLTLKFSVYIAPFILAFAVSASIEPLIRFLTKKAKLSRKSATIISLLLVATTIIMFMLLIISRLYKEIGSLVNGRPQYLVEIYRNISGLVNKALEIYFDLPEDIILGITNMLSNFSDSISKILDSFLKGIYNTAISIPQMFVFIIVTILATYFLSSDRDRISEFIENNFPKSFLKKMASIKNNIFLAFFGYVRAQLILMCITFVELTLGFLIIGVRHFLLLALGISFIDALPVLGTGGVLIPWAVYEFLTRDFKMGISLIILYIIALITRQLVESKILGQQIGLHPLVTLVSMYLGMQFFGVIGFILGPIVVLLFKNIVSCFIKQKNIKEIINEFNKKQ
ncbi:MAG: sporulation integral membrane protein YtvI [Clostridium sp.]|nr:sporulation integral membrane protein YtvI [Clostridium sp.]